MNAEDIAAIEEIIIRVMKDCSLIWHNYRIVNGEAGKRCERCGSYVCDYEAGF